MFNKIREEVLNKLTVNGVYKPGKLNSKQNANLIEQIDTLVIKGFESRSEKILALRLNLPEAPKCYCGNYLKFNTNQRIQSYCSPKCAANAPSTIRKRAATWDERGGKACSEVHKQNLSRSLIRHFSNHDVWNKGKFTETVKAIPSIEEMKVKKEKRQAGARRAGKKRKQNTFDRYLRAAPKDVWKDVLCHTKHGLDYVTLTHISCLNTITVQLQTIRKWNWSDSLCKKCNPIFRGISKAEIELTDFIRTLAPDVQSSVKLPSGLEIDAFIPSKNIAVEYDGLYWHSEKAGYESDKHLRKTEECEKVGIRLIHIFEDEWILKKEIVKSHLRNTLHLSEEKIFAKELSLDTSVLAPEAETFLAASHLNGYCNSDFCFGLRDTHGELLALMLFNRVPGDNNADWEIARYCVKLNTAIIGGASKILRAFSRREKGKILFIADRRWHSSNINGRLGFILLEKTPPRFFLFKGITRLDLQIYQKEDLVQLFLANSDKFADKTVDQIIHYLKLNKIWDCGTLKFIKAL